MILKEINEMEDKVFAFFQSTWNYDYEFMVDAAQSIINDDFKGDLERLDVAGISGQPMYECVDEVRKNGFDLRKCSKLENEMAVLIVAGKSRILDCRIMLTFYNQTNSIRLYTPDKDVFRNKGKEFFTHYLCSVEIKAYCKKSERVYQKNQANKNFKKWLGTAQRRNK